MPLACRRVGLTAVLSAALLTGTACRDAGETPPSPSPRLASLPGAPLLMFVSLASDDTFHKIGFASLAAPAGPTFYTPLSCERAYASRSRRGICLTATETGAKTVWWAEIFDESFAPIHRLALTGAPSRVRISPDGRLAAATVFESGHSYAEHGFSTRTTVFDLERGESLGDLEQFITWCDGVQFKQEDFNFWGVTFAADSDTFYATLDTGGISYLVRGSVRERKTNILAAGVECPSISPDNSRIAFKKRIGAKSLGWWQIAVLRLDSLKESVVTRETRSVDDQVEWLDAERVVYHLTGGEHAADLWTVRVDDSEGPQLLRAASYSPAVLP